jgi:DNA mismatch repair ATPase MutL
METVNEIKEALSARSRTATLDELRSEGKKKVRLIRAEHIAAMVSEAVHSAIEQSGLIAPEEAQRLVEKSRHEFRAILQEREQELQRAHTTEQALEERNGEVAECRRQLAALRQELDRSTAQQRDTEAELYRVRAQFESLQEQQAAAATETPTPPAAPAPAATAAPGPSTDLLLSLVQEMATLKANLMHQQAQERAPAPAAAAAAPAADFSAAFEKLAGSLSDRLEKLGKKMGVSAAVESDATVDFGGLFKDTGKSLESNMGNIEVKQKAAGGIAANLARLKKLKGGG